MSGSINLRNEVQAAIFPILVKELTKGHWAGTTPVGHAEVFETVKVKVNPNKLGRDFDPPRVNYDLLNKEAVENMSKSALKAIKLVTGEEADIRTFRKELKDMMFILRTPQGEPLAQSNQGRMSRPGRPSAADLEALTATPKPKAARRSRSTKGKEAASVAA